MLSVFKYIQSLSVEVRKRELDFYIRKRELDFYIRFSVVSQNSKAGDCGFKN